jgi:hypothetical protein
MKFQEDPLAAPEAAERKLLELANAIKADQGRAPVSEINTQFLAAGGSADEYARAVEAAVVHGWLTLHPSGEVSIIHTAWGSPVRISDAFLGRHASRFVLKFPVLRFVLWSLRMPRTGWTPSIVPNGDDQNVYLVVDDFGRNGWAFRETDVDTADLETVILDLLEDQYKDPTLVVAFNTSEAWSQDASEDFALELRRRCDLQMCEVLPGIGDLVDRRAGPDRQLARQAYP